jgi:solute carrier family 25 (mitochondrial phosphate transporter), member 3
MPHSLHIDTRLVMQRPFLQLIRSSLYRSRCCYNSSLDIKGSQAEQARAPGVLPTTARQRAQASEEAVASEPDISDGDASDDAEQSLAELSADEQSTASSDEEELSVLLEEDAEELSAAVEASGSSSHDESSEHADLVHNSEAAHHTDSCEQEDAELASRMQQQQQQEEYYYLQQQQQRQQYQLQQQQQQLQQQQRQHRRRMKRKQAAGTSLAVAASLIGAGALSVPVAGVLRCHWKSFLAGAVCCSTSHVAGVPMDVVKTRLQCSPEKYSSTGHAFMRILQEEGPSTLLCGTGATLVGYAVQGSLKFGFYEAFKPAVAAALGAAPSTGLALVALMLASALADVIGSSALAPMEAARIRMVSDPRYSGRGLAESLARLSAEEGWLSLFRGLPALLCKQLPYTVTQLVSFELLKGVTSAAAGGSQLLQMAATVGCALAAGVLSSLASQPGDTLLSMVNSQLGDGRSLLSTMMRIISKLGIKGLFKGTGARIIHVSTVVMVQLVLYDAVKTKLGMRK